MGFSWNGTDQEMLAAMDRYERAVRKAVFDVAQFWEPKFEDYAKERASWTDRTANARQGLHAYIEPENLAGALAADMVTLWLSHGMEYGLWLEVKSPDQPIDIEGIETTLAGKYAIILPTIQAHQDEVWKMIEAIFR